MWPLDYFSTKKRLYNTKSNNSLNHQTWKFQNTCPYNPTNRKKLHTWPNKNTKKITKSIQFCLKNAIVAPRLGSKNDFVSLYLLHCNKRQILPIYCRFNLLLGYRKDIKISSEIIVNSRFWWIRKVKTLNRKYLT